MVIRNRESYAEGGLGDRSTFSISRMLSLGAAQKSRGLSPGTGNSSSRACCESLPMKLRLRADALAERRATLKRPRNFIFVYLFV